MSYISRQAEQAVTSNTNILKQHEAEFKQWSENEDNFGDLILSRTIGDLIQIGLARKESHPESYEEITDVVRSNIKVIASTKREALISIGGVVCYCNKYGVISFITQCSLGLKGYCSLEFFTGLLSELVKDAIGAKATNQYCKGDKLYDYSNISLEPDLFEAV